MPLYLVVEVNDDIEDPQAMIAEINEHSEDVVVDVGPYRFNQVQIRQIGTRYPS